MTTVDGGDVVHDAHTMPQPVGSTKCDSFVNRRQPERFTGMDGEVRVGIPHVLEGVQMTTRRIPGLGTGDVEADHTAVTESHSQFGDFTRPGGMTHGGQQAADLDVAPLCLGR